MKLFDKFTNQLKKDLTKVDAVKTSTVQSINLQIAELPKAVEKKNKEYVLWGEDNLYPYKMEDLVLGSAIHGAIVKTKTKMTHGDGFLFNGAKTKEESDAVYNSLAPAIKAQLDVFLKNKNGGESLFSVVKKMANDLQIHGQYSSEVLWSQDFTKIAGLKYTPTKNIRSGKYENDKVCEYYYSRDWMDVRNHPIKKLHAFSLTNRESYNQIFLNKSGSLDYYGTAPYVGAINWIYTDMQMAIFHNANISNGMNPGLHFKFYKLPASQEEQDMIVEGLKKTWQGAMNAGKMLATFSQGKELAMDIAPVQVSDLDKQLLLLAELCDKKILSGHQLTTPLLAGISVSGQLGGNVELETGYTIFDKVAMEADRQMIADDLQTLLDINKIPIKIDINPFKPF